MLMTVPYPLMAGFMALAWWQQRKRRAASAETICVDGSGDK